MNCQKTVILGVICQDWCKLPQIHLLRGLQYNILIYKVPFGTHPRTQPTGDKRNRLNRDKTKYVESPERLPSSSSGVRASSEAGKLHQKDGGEVDQQGGDLIAPELQRRVNQIATRAHKLAAKHLPLLEPDDMRGLYNGPIALATVRI